MKDLTLLITELIKLSVLMKDPRVTNEHIGHHLRSLVKSNLPQDCEVDFTKIDQVVETLRKFYHYS